LEQANDVAPQVGLDVPVRTKGRGDTGEARNRGLWHGDLPATTLCCLLDHARIIFALAFGVQF
jgi:hypothetical protein